MAWLRFSDDWNRRPEIRALDDDTHRVLHCLIEAAENFDACGIVTDDYAMAVYPHARQKLRGRVRKLAEHGMVHLLDGIDDHAPDCPTCEARQTEAGTEAVQKHVQKHPTSASTSARSGRTEAMLICIRCFFDVAMTPEAKAEKRQKDADRQRRKRERDKAGLSRRDAEPVSRPPVPVPVPELGINDHLIASKEREPDSTANPSTPSDVAAEREARSTLRVVLKERWPNPKHPEHIEEIQRLAEQEPGDSMATLAVALDAFDRDTSQQQYRHSPQGLIMHWNRYVADHRQQAEREARKVRAAAAERRHQEAKRRAEEEHWQRVQARRGGKPIAVGDAVTDLIAAIGGGKG